MAKVEQKFYHAVVHGYVDRPTIFSKTTWAYVSPRVTGAKGNDHQSFDTIEAAELWMNEKGHLDYEKIERSIDISTPSIRPGKYWAVACGRKTGVFDTWEEAEASVNKYPHACHQKFKSREQAEAFVEDWKDGMADVWRREIRRHLGMGRRLTPEDLTRTVDNLFTEDLEEITSLLGDATI